MVQFDKLVVLIILVWLSLVTVYFIAGFFSVLVIIISVILFIDYIPSNDIVDVNVLNKVKTLKLKVRTSVTSAKNVILQYFIENQNQTNLYTTKMFNRLFWENKNFERSGGNFSAVRNDSENSNVGGIFKHTSTPNSSLWNPKERYPGNSPIKKTLIGTPLRRPGSYSLSDTSFSVSPRSFYNSSKKSPKPFQTSAGPLIASSKHNIDLSMYADTRSPGLTSRILQYNADSRVSPTIKSPKITHQPKYANPGQFPIVHLNKSPLHSMKPTRKSVTVRIAPPDTTLYSAIERSLILTNNSTMEWSPNNAPREEINTRSVLDALKEISRKRIHARDEDSEPNKRQRKGSVSINCSETQSNSKHSREEDYNINNSNNGPLPKKIHIQNEISSSLSSMKYRTAPIKRKADIAIQKPNENYKQIKLTVTNDEMETSIDTLENVNGKKSPLSEKSSPVLPTATNNVQEILPDNYSINMTETDSKTNENHFSTSSIVEQDGTCEVLFTKSLDQELPKSPFSIINNVDDNKKKLTSFLNILNGSSENNDIERLTENNSEITDCTDGTVKGDFSKKPTSILSTPKSSKNVINKKHVTFDLMKGEDTNTDTDIANKDITKNLESETNVITLSNSNGILSDEKSSPHLDKTTDNPVSSSLNFSAFSPKSQHVTVTTSTPASLFSTGVTPSTSSGGFSFNTQSSTKTNDLSERTSQPNALETTSSVLNSAKSEMPTFMSEKPKLESVANVNMFKNVENTKTTSAPSGSEFKLGTNTSVSTSSSNIPQMPLFNFASSTAQNTPIQPFSHNTTTVSFGTSNLTTSTSAQPSASQNTVLFGTDPPKFGTSSPSMFSLGSKAVSSGINQNTVTPAPTFTNTTDKPSGGFKFNLEKPITPIPSSSFSVSAVPVTGKSTVAEIKTENSKPLFSFAAESNKVNKPNDVSVSKSNNFVPVFGNSYGNSSSFGQNPTIPTSSPSAQAFSVFGTTSTSVQSSTSTQPTSSTFSFGSNSEATVTKPFSFGATNTFGSGASTEINKSFGNQPTGTFGTTSATTTTASSFGTQSLPVFGQPSGTAPAFGQTTSAPTFGQTTSASAFGQTTSAPTFGQTTSAPTFGQSSGTTSAFGQTATVPGFGQATKTPGFGQSTTTAAFGQSTTTSAFGQSTTAPVFGQSTTTASTSFGQPAASSVFGQITNNSTNNQFGNPPASSETVFGATSPFGSNNKPNKPALFGSTSTNQQTGNTFGTNSAPPNAAPFGSTSSNIFGSTNQQPATGFGNAGNQGSNIFGSTTNQQSGSTFGTANQNTGFSNANQSTSVFGSNATPTFGGNASTGFANTTNLPTSAFGNSGNNQQSTGFGGFGAAPSTSGVFTFSGSAQNNNNNGTDGAKTTSSSAFQFGANATQTPGSFNFTAGSGTAAFGASNPTFGSGSSFNPSVPQFAAPAGANMFSIGTGSTAPRPRTLTRQRRQK